jgi:hypothetical protein
LGGTFGYDIVVFIRMGHGSRVGITENGVLFLQAASRYLR